MIELISGAGNFKNVERRQLEQECNFNGYGAITLKSPHLLSWTTVCDNSITNLKSYAMF